MRATGTPGVTARTRPAGNPTKSPPTPPTPPGLVLLLLLSLVSRVRAQPPDPGRALLSPDLAGVAGVPAEEAIVLANRGLRVPFGREVWLDPLQDLVLQVQPGDRCAVTVLDNDALAQRPGRLRPKRFPCDFGAGEVRYSHLGARSPSRDRVRLQLRYDAPGGAAVLPLVLEVEVVFTQLEVVTRNLPLVVEELLGTSNALDARSLEFAYQPETEECRVGILSGLGALPRYGELLHYPQVPGPASEGDTQEALLMDCKAFQELGVRYRHTAPSRSPNRDWVPMVVELRSRGSPVGSPALKREHFQVLVRIRGGAENTAPKPSFVAMMMMEVDQFVLTALTPDMLAAEDAECAPDLLVFNLTSPFQPGQGFLVSTEDRSLPLSSFTQRDLHLLKIAYQPPSEDSDQERLFELELEVVDPEGAASDPFSFMVVVKPMNTLAPVVTRNTGLILYEGQSRPLTGPAGSGPQNLVIGDEDDLEAVQLEVVAGLRHGHLVLLGASNGNSAPKTFTVAELAAGRVVYHHDDKDGSLSDNLVLRMVDGGRRHQVQFLFPITLVPVDDQPPVLSANTGLTLAEGETVPILPQALSAADMDSEDSLLLFVLESPSSTAGHLLLRQTHPPQGEEMLLGSPWRKQGAFYEKTVTEWRQQDITEGRLFYRHSGPHSPGPVIDQFTFRVQDNHDPPNKSGLQRFVIRIHPVDRLPPELGNGCPLRMVVQESQLTPLRKKWLRYTDLDTDDRELRYTVTQPPMDTDENHSPAPLGTLVLTDDPSVVVAHFTQAQVNHHKIAYRPPDQELGVAARVAQFQFQVEDRAGNVAPGTFTFYLQPVDNQPPEILNTGFTVQEKGHHILSEAELGVRDVDTDVAHITFTLIQVPKHGHMKLSGQVLHVGGIFHLEDIKQGRISYAHNGAESLTDSCSLEVSDRHHVVPVTLRVNVRPVDGEVPMLSLPAGTLGSYLDVLENGATEITASVIRGTNRDADDLMLTFLLEDPPLYGEILVNGVPAEQFTQRDILEGSVVYAHTSGEIGLLPKEDSFNLSLSDMSQEWRIGGNTIQGVTVWVTILPVDSQAPEISVGERFIVLEGDKSVITSMHISAKDIDSLNDDILCTIVIQPTSGYVENISPAPGSEKSRAGIAISAFTLKDLRQGHINYVQSVHKGVEPVEDRFIFRCSDGINFSERHFFPIVIIPTNDEQPEIFIREFMVMEGMSLVVDTPILNAADADVPPDDLTFTITRFPTHGHIMNQLINGTVLVESFTLDQIIESSSIIYEHDDSETQEDSFVIKLTDGKHSVEKMVLIMVIPVDDETPRMAINNGLEIEIGETKIINNRILMATDLDSEDKSLVYIIRYGPGHGLLQRQKPAGVFENITLGMNFTQDEVDRNLIQYVHFGQEGIRDLIKFDVTDGINALIDRYFYVSVGSLDIVFPDVISKGVSLKEGGKVTLTTDLLSTSDLNSPDENLVFTITRAPMRGHLESTDQPRVSITSFTQLQLAGNKIYYIHTADDEVKMDSFEFQVTDGRNPVFRTFRISISDVDNKKPVVTIHNLVVSEGEKKLITPFELTVEDRDTPDKLLKFTVTQVPVHGQLLFNNTRPAMVFTKQDLNENLISYRHDGTESSEDSFSFTVTDGSHTEFYVFPDTVFETRRPQVMKIRILAIDNRVPQIAVNKGASTLRTLATGHLGFMITSKVLKAEDKDSLHVSLRFIVTEAPRHGYLLNLGQGNHSVTQFTQADIDDMKICYVLREGANATSDIFHFTVEDGGSPKFLWSEFGIFSRKSYILNQTLSYSAMIMLNQPAPLAKRVLSSCVFPKGVPFSNLLGCCTQVFIPGSRRSPGGGNDNPLQYSCLENPTDRGARDTLPTPVFLGFPCDSTGKDSACNVEDLGSIPGLHTPVFWPGEFHGLYSPWGCKELDMTEQLSLYVYIFYFSIYFTFSFFLFTYMLCYSAHFFPKLDGLLVFTLKFWSLEFHVREKTSRDTNLFLISPIQENFDRIVIEKLLCFIVIYQYFINFPGDSVVKNLPINAGDVGSILGSRISPGEGNSNPLQVQFDSVQSLSRVQLFATLWMAARQATLACVQSLVGLPDASDGKESTCNAGDPVCVSISEKSTHSFIPFLTEHFLSDFFSAFNSVILLFSHSVYFNMEALLTIFSFLANKLLEETFSNQKDVINLDTTVPAHGGPVHSFRTFSYPSINLNPLFLVTPIFLPHVRQLYDKKSRKYISINYPQLLLKKSVSGFGPETRVSDMICVLAIIKRLVRSQTCVATVFDCAFLSFFIEQFRTVQVIKVFQCQTPAFKSRNQKFSSSPKLYFLSRKGFPSGSDGKECARNAGDPGSVPGWRRSHGEGNGYPLQYSCLENSMDRGAWEEMFQVEGKACAKALSLVCSRGQKSINTPGAQLTSERVAPGISTLAKSWKCKTLYFLSSLCMFYFSFLMLGSVHFIDLKIKYSNPLLPKCSTLKHLDLAVVGGSKDSFDCKSNTLGCNQLKIVITYHGLSRIFNSTTIQKHQFFSTQPPLGSSSHIQT
ncbi:hypothetical protein FD755_015581 [Muntiacus reevesi]|uniref:FRAS1-related extracellular matrix protein N-terminal domain-containing protein n=1 Tax=Muntiacus reevesi TaxID=9886 RepID=A0A5N3XFD4_MUNRE|nr:hypothetical protein FD755_015581 [Muntiacus reevesi]